MEYIKKSECDFISLLEDHSKKHIDGSGKTLMVHLEGRANMFGGYGHGIVVHVSGNKNIHANEGDWEIKGKYEYSDNIGRGENGPTSSRAKFGDTVVSIHNSCGADIALSAILRSPKVWIKEEHRDEFREFVKSKTIK